MKDQTFKMYMKDLMTTHAKLILRNNGYVGVFWSLEDIEAQAKEDGVCLTKQEVKEVADLLEKKHDASVGISWDTISHWIEYVVEQRSV